MARVEKRIRLVKNILKKVSGSKQLRYEQKLSFLESLPKTLTFKKYQQHGMTGYLG